ncbi:bifunctional glutamate--cysteine ligase GshA/glutathione synthetase GshB [Enterococcus sp. DIV0242_7C1]|uniref:Glutathione biosynthesis bifunctional protein GshAB n=1 Tax=Candidatus Enterococcus dunnyi TaxID=1834192 RepID=A0A200J1J2_9ENTE|nr:MULTISPECIES: bifunctional glutamate--cysteine ligase GshA/glutathione synthetase GshB [unclassified Enterococcus]MBO0470047.1 bifunctional glutamate--cysteine ligase GshA/glutathione synthetase GshB [Enterococcus sp. DIV0242_7C1]MCA5013596.1 bifunctional glutamate--cysteine ligase GshA/glutathione synthetase GshB [Enterococcus sp. S23]MCA5016846.1 bifunctional glutamate--cysteine ligase GshA/glutathione synthetase GshB [Enterococcus sp. S22(2020)]OUZ30497.1 glutathione biosynthesis GshAB [E
MKFKELLQQKSVRPYTAEARFGLEKESQRTTFDGALAKTDHPAILGNRSYHPYIQTDFSETQVELITPVANSINEMLRYLAAIHDVALRSMNKSEMLWPLSMPPKLPEKDEEIKIAKLEQFEGILYRRYLAREYGKRKQMVSGIHFNFEYAIELVQQLFAVQTEYETIEDFKNILYMKVSRNYLRYRWLITYLFGASPVSEEGYFTEKEDRPKEPVRSIRNSAFGYKNKENVKVSYESLQSYIDDIHRMVENGILSEEKEFYSAVRLRGGKQMSDLPKTGIRYIELRNLDLNPFAPLGIEEESLEFIHLFMLYLLWTDEKETPNDWVATGDLLNEQVALGHPFAQVNLVAEGDRIFAEMDEMIETLGLFKFKKVLEIHRGQLRTPDLTIAGKMWTIIESNSNHELGIVFGKEYQGMVYERPYQLAGFRNMELSTQLFLFDVIQKGIEVQILDEQEQFLKLTHEGHVEYVKNANMTSKDSYIVPLIMENKTVTKKVLAEAGFNVPAGDEFDNLEQAEQAYMKYSEKAFVIKPKTTNYGLGITIFKEGASLADYSEALKLAFKEDSAVLIEEFLPGTEYRFFVIDDQVRAILLRVPANVVGDGVRSVEALVAEKNLNPLRGTHHRSPLEIIQLGDVERLMLKEQNLLVTSVPEKDQVVYLRENSNISTGGDSIDVTDDFDESYKQIAIEAVKALGAKICGIDLIIPDKTIKGSKDNQTYGIIEANFNPAMHMHTYPHAGQGRHLTMDVLKLLYPEVF